MVDYEIHNSECLEFMRTMGDNSVDAIITDPPYFKVKGDAWDRQWDKPDQFLAWLDLITEQWHRILRPNGSLYCFASPKMAARVEVTLAKRFEVLNHITWVKGIRSRMAKHEADLRSFVPMSERVVFCEHYNADNIAKGEAGYGAKCDELRGFVFEPLRAYICDEFDRAGMLNTDGKIKANVACGFSPSSGGMASRHYFSRSQWQLPTLEHYTKLRQLLNRNGGKYLRREYEDLRREYEDLRREYEDLRRPFTCRAQDVHTDVWVFDSTNNGKRHPCEKPLDLMRHIIKSSTREGQTVLDCFMGSGSTGVACVEMGRNFIGIEMDSGYCETASERISDALEPDPQVELFT